MELDPTVFDQKLAAFLSEWNGPAVETMTLQQYANLNDPHSFCYWLEYGSPELGAIGNNSLNKFGIWIPKEENKHFNKMFKYDGTYAWYATLGQTAGEAFANIHSHILKIVQYAQSNQFAKIEAIKTHSIIKWKIAFLYSDKQLLPVYSRPALLQISKGLNGHFNDSSSIFELQSYILAQKPAGETVEVFVSRIYKLYRLKNRRFYVFGSKYSDDKGGDTVDKLPAMLKAGDVAIGFMGYFDFSAYTSGSVADIDQLVTANYKEKKPELAKMKRYFKLLMQIKEGDIIAVKSHGTHNKLTIVAYATVVERNGRIYSYQPGQLGHHIHVEFMDWDFKRATGLTYAETIHEIKAGKPELKKIFGPYALFANGSKTGIPDEANEDGDNGDKDRDEDDYTRGNKSQVVVRQIHNIMQNRFMRYLKANYVGQHVQREYENRIDVYRQSGRSEWMYEIKPFESPYRCVREGIGQLLDYVHRFKKHPNLTIIIVGPEEPKIRDQKFIEHIRQTLGLNFEYQSFDYLNHKD
jgi:hypothetical protein